MENKEVAKRYLISVSALYFIGALFLALFLYSADKFNFSAAQSAGVAALLSLIPAGSYTGFVNFGLRIKEINAKHGALLIIFFPLILAFITVSGIIMFIPSLIKTSLTLIRS